MRNIFLAIILLATGSGAYAAPSHAWWYTSSSGSFDDECASPYAYSNYGHHSYPYDMYDANNHGNFLYHAAGHVHPMAAKPVQVIKITRRAPKPAHEPIFEEPMAKPEGD